MSIQVCNNVQLDCVNSPPLSKDIFLIVKVIAWFQFFAFYKDSIFPEGDNEHFKKNIYSLSDHASSYVSHLISW